MGLILIFVGGAIVILIVILSIFGFASDRMSHQAHLKDEIDKLEKRIEKLEEEKGDRI